MTNPKKSRPAQLLLFVFSLSFYGCGEDASSASPAGGNSQSPMDNSAGSSFGGSGQNTDGAGKETTSLPPSKPAATTSADPDTDNPPAQGGRGLPCDVEQVLAERCSQCHGSEPQFGAPMSLLSYEDLTAPGLTDSTRSVAELVVARVSDESRPMPPAPYERLEADELAVLNSWLNGGAQRSNEECETPTVMQPGGDTDYFADLPGPERCDVTVDLLASNDGGAYQVPQEDDHYECFYFTAPPNYTELTGLAPIIDDQRVLHHWLLYVTTNADLVPGTHEKCAGVHPEDTLLGGWAPGGETYAMPEGVGLQMPQGEDARFILELHYNNVARHTDAMDRSGVRVCMTEKPHENLAAVHWLGTENIFLLPGEGSGTTTCTPVGNEPVTVLSVTPHMHELGTHSSMVINRADGSKDTLLDEPFDFNTQIGYDTPATLMPGDTLTTTCTWNNTKGALTTFGSGTSSEMCYLFTVAYPIGALNTGGDLLGVGVLGGPNKCMK